MAFQEMALGELLGLFPQFKIYFSTDDPDDEFTGEYPDLESFWLSGNAFLLDIGLRSLEELRICPNGGRSLGGDIFIRCRRSAIL